MTYTQALIIGYSSIAFFIGFAMSAILFINSTEVEKDENRRNNKEL